MLPRPNYIPVEGKRLAFATKANAEHMTDEAWQLFQALDSSGYYTVDWDCNVVFTIGDRLPVSTVVLQDKREWEGLTANRTRVKTLTGVTPLAGINTVFKLTVLKDAQNNLSYHRGSAEEMGCHAWIVYYHPLIVKHLAPYVRQEHLVRTYHSLDANLVPPFRVEGRRGCILSGAISGAYPLRTLLAQNWQRLPGCHYLKHPGYHQRGCETPNYLATLNNFKVAICTSSRFGYAVRKIMEATACGCRVITDLPVDEVLPEIDANLVKVDSTISVEEMAEVVAYETAAWDADEQTHYSLKAQRFYDYRAVGRRLADDIEALRRSYNAIA